MPHHRLLSPEQTKIRAEAARAELVEFLRGCDVLILDAQYTDEEYRAHIGWGHGSLTTAVSLATDAGVKQLILFHHDPTHNDTMIDNMASSAKSAASDSGKHLIVEPAREGVEIILGGRSADNNGAAVKRKAPAKHPPTHKATAGKQAK
jgi:hypothetical protein